MQRVLMMTMLALAMAVPGLLAQAKPPMPKSKEEMEALQAMVQAPDPDARIKAAENLVTKFADTNFKALAFYMEAVSYQQKNDYEKMIVNAERSVQADPKQYAALLMLARGIAQRTREFDLDREEKLTRAEKYAKDALDILKDAPKPNPQITDEQWTQGKREFSAQAHEALGFAAVARKNFPAAIEEMKTAIEESPDAVTMVRLAQVYNQTGKPDDALPLIDKVMAMQDLHPAIRQFAQAEKVRATQLKNAGAPPAANPPPAETKKQ